MVTAELYLAFTLAHPEFLCETAVSPLRDIYMDCYRNIVQFEPGFAVYDNELTYTLAPGPIPFQTASSPRRSMSIKRA